MDHPANVWFIDAHAEGDRRADDPRFIAQEKFLIARTFRGVESRVVGTGEEAATGQRFGHAADESGLGRSQQHKTPVAGSVGVNRASQRGKYGGDRLCFVENQSVGVGVQSVTRVVVKALRGAWVLDIGVMAVGENRARQGRLAHLTGSKYDEGGKPPCQFAQPAGEKSVKHACILELLLLKCKIESVTPARPDLLNTLRGMGPVSVYALAKAAGRNYSNVHADIARLVDLGLVERTDDDTVLVPFDTVEIHMALAQVA